MQAAAQAYLRMPRRVSRAGIACRGPVCEPEMVGDVSYAGLACAEGTMRVERRLASALERWLSG